MRSFRNRVVLFALSSVTFFAHVYGELIMIRHPRKNENGNIVQDFSCISEADGGVLLWNEKFNNSSGVTEFDDTYKKFQNCREYLCIKGGTEGWEEYSSFNRSSGPVFNYRWLDLAEVKGKKLPLDSLRPDRSVVFSVRGSGNIHVLFHATDAPENKSCFSITIEKSENSTSRILPCNDKVPDTSRSSSQKSDRSVDGALEWRTYIIKRLKEGRIEVFENTKNISDQRFNEWTGVKFTMIESPDEQRFRLHEYTYLFTQIPNNTLVRSSIKCDGRDFYAELMFSVCFKCQLKVELTNGERERIGYQIFHRDVKGPNYNPPFWQLEKLHISLGEKHCDNTTTVKISTEMTPSDSHFDYWWAFGSFMLLEPKGRPQQKAKRLYVSNMTDFACQKLAYAENQTSIVHSNDKIRNINLSNAHKYVGGEWVLFDSKFSYPGNGTSVCNQKGCTCAPGFTGNNCNKGCPEGRYAYNCQKSCGHCGGHTCDGTNGTCESKCRAHYIPPDCVKKLGLPYIRCNSESGLLFNCPEGLDADQKSNLHFEIKKTGDEWTASCRILEACIPSARRLEVIKKLEPQMRYRVRAVINGTTFAETDFRTSCWIHSKPQNLSVVSRTESPVFLRWEYEPYLWERARVFELQIESLDLELKKIRYSELKRNYSFPENETKFQVDWPLQNLTNYMFSVRIADEHFIDTEAASALYLLPDSLSFATIEKLQNSDRMRSISFALPYRDKATKEAIVDVIVAGASACPNLEGTQDSTRSEERSETREYPVCSLRYNETYRFPIDIHGAESERAQLIWLVVLPVFAVCGALVYVLHGKYKLSLFKKRSHSVMFVNEAAPERILEPEELPFDSCVPPEVQKFRIFENYVKRSAENDVLRRQFLSLPRGLVRSCECGRLPMNKRKNRYGNLIAYDETRVLLVRDSSGINSDYINANYVHGYAKEKAYIATQAPLSHTIVDFWRMVWQEEVRIICMLVDTNIREQYWPEIGKKVSYGDVTILTINQRVFAEYTYRSFLLTSVHSRESQIIEHLQYTGWPDTGVPMYSHSVVEYLQKLLSVAPGQGPIVVHCNSGTGRTGTIILADIAMRRLAVEGTVDVFSEAKLMYSARADMLSEFAQYVLAHLVPTQCLLMASTKVRCSDITQEKISEMKNEVPRHMARIEECSWMDKALRPLEPIRPRNPENLEKNRFPELAPVGSRLVSLKCSPRNGIHSDYISAVSVDGVKIKNQYIASQLPMPSTLADFWGLILQKNIELVVVLQDPDPTDPTCCVIIPHESPMIPLPYLKVETQTSSICGEYYTIDKLLLTDMSQEPSRMRTITALTCHNWSSDRETPPAPEILVELWRASEKIQREGPTLVLCYNGVLGCGLYSALSFMLERMAVEHECDVVLAVQAVRRTRTEFMSFQWEFEYLYDAALKYAESFQDYGNFAGAVGSNQWYREDDGHEHI